MVSKRNIQHGVAVALQKCVDDRTVKANEGYDKVIGFIYSNCGAANCAANIYVTEVVDYLEEHGLYKQLVKKYANNCLDVYRVCHRTAIENLNEDPSERVLHGNRTALWENQNLQMYSIIEDDIKELEKAVEGKVRRHYKNLAKNSIDIAQRLDKIDYQTYAKLYTARIMIELANQRCEKIFEIVSKDFTCGYDMSNAHPEFLLDGMRDWWVKVIALFVGNVVGPVFALDAFCIKFFGRIDEALSDTKNANEAALSALKFDPAFNEAVKELEANAI